MPDVPSRIFHRPTSLIPSSNGCIHNDGADSLAEDDHVKFLRPGAVSGGPAAASDGDTQDQNGSEAAGTTSLSLEAGGPTVTLTFSPT